MKTSLFTSIVIVALFAATASAAPRIYVEHPVHNFGTLIQGKKFDHTFVIKNSGDSPLKITHIRPACGCTAANATSPIVPAGRSSEIKVSFNSANFVGAVSKTIAVETNDPATPVYTLTLSGTIAEEISVKPKQLNLGQVRPEASTVQYLTLENRSSRPLKLISVKSPMPQLAVKQDKSVVRPGESAKITVTVTPRQDDRMLSGYLSISTDNPDKQEIMIPVYGSLAK